MAQAAAPAYTCTACNAVFSTCEEHRSHYKLDWHRYNLKRKVSGLEPVAREDFERRLALVASASGAKADYKGHCKDCRKTFNNEKLYEQHLLSKKHLDTVKTSKPAARSTEHASTVETSSSSVDIQDSSSSSTQQAEPVADVEMRTDTNAAADDMEPDSDEQQQAEAEETPAPMGPDICIFCNYHSAAGFEANCEHMLKKHGFFIPDAEYLTDPEGLVNYCAEKVKIGNICLVCNGHGRTFWSWRSVQQHMIDRSHCKILYEEGEDLHEFDPFYDFSSSYTDAERAAAVADGSDSESTETGPQLEVTHLGELQLLDGRVVGHRQYDRYYKQAAPRQADSRSAVRAARDEQRQALIAMYGEDAVAEADRAGTSGRRGELSAMGAAKRQPELHGKALQQLQRAQRVEQRESLKLGIKQNKLNRTFKRVLEM